MFAAHHRLSQPRRHRRPQRSAGPRLHEGRARSRHRWPSAGGPSAGMSSRSTGTTTRRCAQTLAWLATDPGLPRARRRDRLRQGRVVHGTRRSSGTTGRCRTRDYGRRSRRSEQPRESAHSPRRSSSWPSGRSRVMLLTGDLGYMALEPFADRISGSLLQRRRRRAEHGRHRDRPGRGRVRSLRLLDRDVRDAAAVRVHPQRPGAARPAGADRRHGRRRFRVRPCRAHAPRHSKTSA